MRHHNSLPEFRPHKCVQVKSTSPPPPNAKYYSSKDVIELRSNSPIGLSFHAFSIVMEWSHAKAELFYNLLSFSLISGCKGGYFDLFNLFSFSCIYLRLHIDLLA